MLYLSNLEKKILSNRRGIKVAFFRVQRPDYAGSITQKRAFAAMHDPHSLVWFGDKVRFGN